MQNFLSQFLTRIDVYIVFIVLLSGFFQKRYLKSLIVSKDSSYNEALKTLFLSFVVAVVYILLLRTPGNAKPWADYFISYFFATSAYELLLQPFLKAIGINFNE